MHSESMKIALKIISIQIGTIRKHYSNIRVANEYSNIRIFAAALVFNLFFFQSSFFSLLEYSMSAVVDLLASLPYISLCLNTYVPLLDNFEYFFSPFLSLLLLYSDLL